MTEVSKEAVEALHAALSCTSSIDDFSVGAPAEVIKHLNAKGFTIICTEPAMTEMEDEYQLNSLEAIICIILGAHASKLEELIRTKIETEVMINALLAETENKLLALIPHGKKGK